MRCLAVIIVATVAALGAAPTYAQDYPTKPVKIIVPFAAGGPADVYARFLGQRLCRRRSASRSSSTTGPAPARSSAPTRSPRARPTATRCC